LEEFQDIPEIIAAITGLSYIIQAARMKRNAWFFGGISTLIFAYIFIKINLYVDGTLNIYYTVMAFYGWFSWQSIEEKHDVSRLKILSLIFAVIATLTATVILSFILIKYTEADLPIFDSFIGASSVTATWLTVKKKIENWPFWICANAVAVWVCLQKDLNYTAALMVVYFILSITGWIQWHKNVKHA
jgi:nicotinamide mononucleotide transporter